MVNVVSYSNVEENAKFVSPPKNWKQTWNCTHWWSLLDYDLWNEETDLTIFTQETSCMHAYFALQMLQVFESHAGILGYPLFCRYSLPYLRQISKQVKAKLTEKSLQLVPMVISDFSDIIALPPGIE